METEKQDRRRDKGSVWRVGRICTGSTMRPDDPQRGPSPDVAWSVAGAAEK